MDDTVKMVRDIADKFGEMQEQQKRFRQEFDQYKDSGDPLALAKADKLNDSISALEGEIKSLQTAVEAEKARADELEARMSAGYKPADEREETRQKHVELFEKFIRTGGDPQTDLALIKIDSKDDLPTVRLGRSDKLQVGEWVAAIGSPFGLEQTITAGNQEKHGSWQAHASGDSENEDAAVIHKRTPMA